MSKTHTINNNDFLGSLVDGSLGGKVISTSSLDSGLVNGDNGTVGVGNKAVAVASAVAVRSNSSSSVESTSKAASSSKVVSTGSSHGRLVGRDDGTVGVGDKSGEASVDGDDAVVVGVGVAGSVGERSSSNRVDGTAGGGVGNLGSVHLRGVDGDDGSVGVADESSEVGVAGSVAEGVNRVDSASSSSVSGLGSDHVSGVGRHHGAVGVGHQLGG